MNKLDIYTLQWVMTTMDDVGHNIWDTRERILTKIAECKDKAQEIAETSQTT